MPEPEKLTQWNKRTCRVGKRWSKFCWSKSLPRGSQPLGPPVSLDPGEVRFEAFRAGGPGGQHQNKTESAVRAVHVPSGLAAVARDGRSQHRNKAIAVERLAMLLRTSQEIAAIVDRQAVHSNHDRLERGNPVRRFRGNAFEPA